MKPLKFSDNVRPICLPSEDADLKDGEICVSAGWGTLCEYAYVCLLNILQVQLNSVIRSEEEVHLTGILYFGFQGVFFVK